MLSIGCFLITCVTTEARTFNITQLIVPSIVAYGQNNAEIECRYNANFTNLNWFRGTSRFFRYTPRGVPSTFSAPLLGTGWVELVECGLTVCRLKLRNLTEDATGFYRCDIERNTPPYDFDTKMAYMKVYRINYTGPLLDGLASEFADHEEMYADCCGARDVELRWYINGREVKDLRGSSSINKTISGELFIGEPPTVTVQCIEFKYGKELLASNTVKAVWKNSNMRKNKTEKELSNASIGIKLHFGLLCVLLNIYSFLFTLHFIIV